MQKRFSSLALALVTGIGVALLSAGMARATGSGASPPTFTMNGGDLTEGLGCQTDRVTVCSGEGLKTELFDLNQWQFLLDPDPTVSLFFALQNPTAVAQTYVFSALLPIGSALGPGVTVLGSVSGSLTNTNPNGGGATLTDDGSSIYGASIDGTTVQTLLDPPQSITTTAFGSNTIGPAAFGPLNLGVTASSNIGITIQFTLSPGDAASFTSVFNVVAVPEPGTLLLLGSGLVGIVSLRRRAA